MPKVISEAERQLTLKSIREAGISLIRKKGLKHVTVDDIILAAGIGKSSFYTYYPSKEEMLYEIMKGTEKNMFETTLEILKSKEPLRVKMEAVLSKIYLSPESLVLYVNPQDFEVLMRKLPAKYRELEKNKSTNNFELLAQLLHFQVTPLNYGTIAYLMDSLTSIATSPYEYGEEGRRQAMNMIVGTISDYIVKEMGGE